MAVVEQLGESEAAGVHHGTVDRIARDGTGGGDDRAGAAETGDVHRRRMRVRADLGGAEKLHEGEDVVRALGEERVIVAEGVAGKLAGVGDESRLLHGLAVLQEIALEKQVGTEHRRSCAAPVSGRRVWRSRRRPRSRTCPSRRARRRRGHSTASGRARRPAVLRRESCCGAGRSCERSRRGRACP